MIKSKGLQIMCGRTACALAPDDVVRACTYRDRLGKRRRPAWIAAPGGRQYRTGYNIAPGAHTPVLLSSSQLKDKNLDTSGQSLGCERVVMPMKWGLTPPWHKGDPCKVPYETNNCRSEGMLEKTTFKVPLQKGNRCVILAEGFFEWKRSKEGLQPYYFYFPLEQKAALTTQKTEEVSEKCKKLAKLESHGCNTKTWPLFSQLDHKAEQRMGGSTNPECGELSSSEGKVKLEPVLNKDNGARPTEVTKLALNSVKQEAVLDSVIKEKVIDYVKQECGTDQQNDVTDGELALSEWDEVEEEEPEWEAPRLLTMAGVFDVWRADKNSEPLYSYSIITVSASPDMDWCHHRMPAILSNDAEVEMWLDSSCVPLNKAVSLIHPKVCLSHHAVSKQVNSTRYQAADCVKPVEIGCRQIKPSPESNMMHRWLQSATPGKRKLQD